MKKLGSLAILVVAILSASTQAAIIATHATTTTPMLTPFGETNPPFNQPSVSLSLPEFDQSAYPNWILEEVCVTVEGIATTEVSITAITDTFVNSATVGAMVQTFDYSPGPATFSVSANPSNTLGPFTLLAGTSTPMTTIVGTDTSTTSITGAGISNYMGAGNFTLDVLAFGTSTLDINGGNVQASQTTEAEAIVTVTYKGTYVPEPSGLAMLPMLGIGLVTAVRRRRK